MVREARIEDLDELLRLYLFLHEDSIPEMNEHLEKTWNLRTNAFYTNLGYKEIKRDKEFVFYSKKQRMVELL